MILVHQQVSELGVVLLALLLGPIAGVLWRIRLVAAYGFPETVGLVAMPAIFVFRIIRPLVVLVLRLRQPVGQMDAV